MEGATTAYRTGFVPCVNHGERERALVRCRTCSVALCDACATYEVNDDVFCEACGSALEEETKPPYARGFAIFAVGFLLTSSVWAARILFLPGRFPLVVYLLLFGYGGSIALGWNTVHPLRGIERPRVARRAPHTALPRAARRIDAP